MMIHFNAVKRILLYLKGTTPYGISYVHGSLDLQAFSDADWAGDPNDRRSIIGRFGCFTLIGQVTLMTDDPPLVWLFIWDPILSPGP
ncbi:hypothetical protein DKX38_026946 [Salix brachista]|uniref:Reverse transcriptase Ty1/copia-type domain-containing protein n=1 Tax=Salix brachista TaxID=2182728 RepID=A0A5N5JAT0_9ROSI|nr:hypothetical protein DKX38_026946 [Salix brachista]